MASNEGFLTDEQREMMKVATENHSTSQKPHSSLLSEYLSKPSAAAGGKAYGGGSNAVKHRRSHAGKSVRAKKGELGALYCTYIFAI